MTQNVLLIGATGMLGNKIASELLDQADARVLLLLRSSKDPAKQATLLPLLDRGAEFIEGDLANRDSLDRATQGIDVIISAAQGARRHRQANATAYVEYCRLTSGLMCSTPPPAST